MRKDLIPLPSVDLVQASEVPSLLGKIRPSWQAKNLIVRVHRLLEADPSSACQRLFNAAVHDLREKIVIAGIDIAGEAAKIKRLPPVSSQKDVEDYSTSNLIELAYAMGLLTRPEWRRLSRCYEIRRDLEHEDDEYEAGVEDCIYIFKTCVEVVLARDPIHLLRVTDVKDLVQQDKPVVPAETLMEDFAGAPQPRQEEISKLLISLALDPDQSDLVQQNAFTVLSHLSVSLQNPVRLKLAEHLQQKIGRDPVDRRIVRVSLAAGVLPYLRQAQIADFFTQQHQKMLQVGAHWSAYDQHGELLRSFAEVGGLQHAPQPQRRDILIWLVLTYIGEKGGMTRYGHVRQVFSSDTAAPHIRRLISDAADLIREELRGLRTEKSIASRLQNPHIARRFEDLLDLVEEDDIGASEE